ncbi:MAG: branched-chain amino acid aminotransferase, partial [Candidatus Kariarchaeaceae archaeon]
MEIMQSPNIEIEKLTVFKTKPQDNDLKFGREFTDRMFLRVYKEGAWQQGKIIPYQNFSLPPSTMVFHYGQEIFEGLKAFNQVDGTPVMFRPDENAKRFAKSAIRM